MPELPEVETVMQGLKPVMEGQRIARVKVRRTDLRFAVPDALTQTIAKQRVKALSRRAKYILITLENGAVMLSHLGMSGKWLATPTWPKKHEKHDHIILEMEDGTALTYNDPRRFGMLLLSDEENINAHPLLANLGPEPLSQAFTAKYLKEKLRTKKAAIKPTIMQQEVVVGVGNIYASEALFLAGINPAKPANTLTLKQCETLITCIQKTLKAAIKSGGSTLRDFVRSSGDSGYFQHNFKVYDRANEPCTSCQKPISHAVQAQRSTYWCPKCQK